MSEELTKGQTVHISYDAVIGDVVIVPSEDDHTGWLELTFTDDTDDGIEIIHLVAPYTSAHAITEPETSEWGLWDEACERWYRRGYHTAEEAGAVRTEIERHFGAFDDTNLQIARVEEAAVHTYKARLTRGESESTGLALSDADWDALKAAGDDQPASGGDSGGTAMSEQAPREASGLCVCGHSRAFHMPISGPLPSFPGRCARTMTCSCNLFQAATENHDLEETGDEAAHRFAVELIEARAALAESERENARLHDKLMAHPPYREFVDSWAGRLAESEHQRDALSVPLAEAIATVEVLTYRLRNGQQEDEKSYRLIAADVDRWRSALLAATGAAEPSAEKA